MATATLILLVGTAVAADHATENAPAGVIEGVVVNGTRGNALVPRADVALRVRVDGQFVGLARTASDANGSFRFGNLPADPRLVFLPGASHGDVHFPGPRIVLSPRHTQASARLTVFDSLSDASPLVLRKQDIVVAVEPGVLRVQESMLIDNPSSVCYVGSVARQSPPVTLRLHVPSDFQRVTFDKEALGRQFALRHDRLVTGMPWPPGTRELSFTYVIPHATSTFAWQRALDLPCAQVTLTVRTDELEVLSCNLPNIEANEEGHARYALRGNLPTGHLLRLELGQLPLSLTVYGRYVALLVLGALIVAATIATVRSPKNAGRVLNDRRPPRRRSAKGARSPAPRTPW